MKKTTTVRAILALLLLASMLFSMLCACTGGSDNNDDNGSGDPSTNPDTPSQGEGPDDPDGGEPTVKVEYSIKVLSAGGLALDKVKVYVYADDTLDDLEGFAETNADGVATMKLPKKSAYSAVLTGVPEGYDVAKSYAITGTFTSITLTSAVIKSESLAGVSYELGSVMHDFSVITRDGENVRLSELLKEKKAVMLNFWFTTCTWCLKEFPYMASAYEKFKDDIEILAMNHTDTEDDIDMFEAMYGLDPLPFPKVRDYTQLKSAFSIGNYPTSVIIDRYGVICLIEVGGVPSAEPFEKAFEYFSADNYTQKLFANISELTPIEKPTVDMPSSDEIGGVFNKGEIEVTYRPETEEGASESAWPFVIGEKNGVSCIMSSNAGKSSTFAIMYADVTLKKGQALAFDYISSSERGADALVIIVDGEDIYQISGVGENWSTCYPYVATEDGTYEVAFVYMKDSTTNEGDDRVYLKDLRVVSEADVDSPTYIPRNAATNPDEFGFSYQDYVTPVFNEKDGYYHVNDKNGPLLIANLMGYTNFSDSTIYNLVCDPTSPAYQYYDEILPYFSYASNSEFNGFCTVNAELRDILESIANVAGLEPENPNQWLKMCVYYDAYGTNGAQLVDPIRGLAPFSAFEAKEGKDNSVTYNRVIMPRGLLYKFVPTRSGAYRITSDSDYEVNAWIFLEENIAENKPFYTYNGGERMYNDSINCSMVMYMEAGKAYYIDIAYYDVYQEGTFTFEIKYLAPTTEIFTIASPGFFTYYENENTESVNEIIAGGIDVVLGSDGYYHEKRADGSLGSVVYADFVGSTGIFNKSLTQMIALGSFNFAMTEGDQYILTYIAQFYKDLGIDADARPADHREALITKFKELWGDSYTEYASIYEIEDVIAGIYHGEGEDLTALAQKYANDASKVNSPAERVGCVAVNEELAELLQILMDKYTFEGVDTSWRKLCYYYQYFGPQA